MVIDKSVTLTGSYNWTRGAAANSENLNLVSSPAVAVAYAAHWHNRLACSVRFEKARTRPMVRKPRQQRSAL
jgi:phosphatidylserine/phosphatidylglycerophosphate/cardiolipin synthase-like enzyme